MKTIRFERGQDPKTSMEIGIEYYRSKKIAAVKNQNFEEAAMWRDKEKEFLDNEATDNRG